MRWNKTQIRHTKVGAGFTMIELLAVIAIVLVLAILATGAGSSMIGRANTTKSSANLRQIGAAVALYATDNDGFLLSKDAGASNFWIKQLYERIYGKPWQGYQPTDTAENLRGTVFFSPNLSRAESLPWRPYGWNNNLQVTKDGQVSTPPKLAAIPNPSRLILLGDSKSSSSLFDVPRISFRNQGMALLLFADFDVELRKPEQIPYDIKDSSFFINP